MGDSDCGVGHRTAIIKINNCLDCGAITPFPHKKWKLDSSNLHVMVKGKGKRPGFVKIAWVCDNTGKVCCWQRQGANGSGLTFIPIPKFCPYLEEKP